MQAFSIFLSFISNVASVKQVWDCYDLQKRLIKDRYGLKSIPEDVVISCVAQLQDLYLPEYLVSHGQTVFFSFTEEKWVWSDSNTHMSSPVEVGEKHDL